MAADNVHPGGRQGAVSWQDASGNFWLFGGSNATHSSNDLWKYDPGTNRWTWMKGDSTAGQYGVYGRMGIEDAQNKPGARRQGVSWADTSGNLWLFGGIGYAAATAGLLNDLWRYNPLTNAWTWMWGDSIVDKDCVCGIDEMPNDANEPNTRFGSAAWTDNAGKFWLFGGRGYLNAPYPVRSFDDLWRYDPEVNQWTRFGGDRFGDGNGSYGTKGVPSPANRPRARYLGSGWKDASGNFWLFGGKVYFPISISFNNLNDLWKYDLATNQWTWMGGAATLNKEGVYGSPGVPGAANEPGARDAGATWTDTYGGLWLYGGRYENWSLFNQPENNMFIFFNDLWKYNLASGEWTWVKGDSITGRNRGKPGVYGIQNRRAITNQPGSRYGAVSWADAGGSLWLFGGHGFAANQEGYLNDLWKISTNAALPLTLLSLTAVAVEMSTLVNWQTAEERNLAHFVVERSAKGSPFQQLRPCRP